MRDGWMYQGRQYHMWFGHGTKPKAGDGTTPKDQAGPLADHIHDVGHALIAALPASSRSQSAVRLNPDDHGRLDRLLMGVVHALPLGPRLIPLRVFGTNPDTPGIGEFIEAGSILKAASTQADLREATDLVARSAQQMGLDRFKPFLRAADDHLARSGGTAALLQEMRTSPTPAVIPRPTPGGPRLPPPGQFAPLLGAVLIRAGLLALAGIALGALIRANREAQIRAAFERFQLDPSKPADVAAVLAYVWARVNRALLLGTSLPESAQDAVAERVMRSVQADPTLLDRAMSGDAKALAAIREAVQSVASGFAIETRTDAERNLVSRMTAEGKSASEIQAALDLHRASTTPGTAEERRNTPGVAVESEPLERVEGPWLSSEAQGGAKVPKQVAERLVGREFENFRAFREEFWRTVASIPELARAFSPQNITRMQNGNAPYAPEPRIGVRGGVWELHHDPAIGHGGAVYDLSTITVVTPRQHDIFHNRKK